MPLPLQALIAVVPILIAAVLLVGFRWPVKWAMPIVYVVSVVIALTAWQVSFAHVAASTIQGLFITFNILYIACSDYLQMITTNAALFHGITGPLMPLLMVMMTTRFYGANKSWTDW